MKRMGIVIGAFLALALAAGPAMARTIVQTKMTGPYRIVLNVLPPEPFFTKKQVKDKHLKAGMVIERGAAPDEIDGPGHPNHHLVVHIYDKDNGLARTNAQVKLTLDRLDADGDMMGKPVPVPVVEMELVGKGPISTHYGNNVRLKPGTYRLLVHVDGYDTSFKFTV